MGIKQNDRQKVRKKHIIEIINYRLFFYSIGTPPPIAIIPPITRAIIKTTVTKIIIITIIAQITIAKIIINPAVKNKGIDMQTQIYPGLPDRITADTVQIKVKVVLRINSIINQCLYVIFIHGNIIPGIINPVVNTPQKAPIDPQVNTQNNNSIIA